MKHSKTLGLTALALAALMAMAGTASATTLTWPSGTTYTGVIRSEATSNLTFTSAFGGFGSISCTFSVLDSTVKNHGASSTVSGTVLEWTLKACTGGEVTSPIAVAGSFEIHRIGANVGNWTSLGAEIVIHNTALGTCGFSTAKTGTSIGTLTGSPSASSSAILDVKATLTATSGICGNATLEGSYILSPIPLLIDA